jgi:hypothetical protein
MRAGRYVCRRRSDLADEVKPVSASLQLFPAAIDELDSVAVPIVAVAELLQDLAG